MNRKNKIHGKTKDPKKIWVTGVMIVLLKATTPIPTMITHHDYTKQTLVKKDKSKDMIKLCSLKPTLQMVETP